MNKATRLTLFSSKEMDWQTPVDFFSKLDKEFNFTLDPAAVPVSALCEKYFTPEDDGLKQDWSEDIVFCNPPYGRSISNWIRKGYQEGQKTTVVFLIPSRTDTAYWHDYVMKADEIRFVRGRIAFYKEGYDNKAPFPSAVVIWRPNSTNPTPFIKTMERT